jgi:hypothetical protein
LGANFSPDKWPVALASVTKRKFYSVSWELRGLRYAIVLMYRARWCEKLVTIPGFLLNRSTANFIVKELSSEISKLLAEYDIEEGMTKAILAHPRKIV